MPKILQTLRRKQAQAVTYQWQIQDPFLICQGDRARDYWHQWLRTRKAGRTNHKSAATPLTPEVPTLHLPEEILIMILLAISTPNHIIKTNTDSRLCKVAKWRIIWRTFAKLFRMINRILLILLVWRPGKEIREARCRNHQAPKIWRKIYKSSN